MAERYERIFKSNGEYYTEDSPVVYLVGVLLKDTKQKRIVAQLKFRNISRKIIRAARIQINAKNSFEENVEGIFEFTYADLNTNAGDEWGQDVAITMPDITTRVIDVVVKSVVYEEGNVWQNSETTGKLLSKPSLISDELKDKELVKQFKLEYGEKSQNLYLEEHGIWHCVCGNINLSSDEECFACKAKKELLATYDLETLKVKTSERLEEERIKREEAEKQRQIEAERRAEEARIQQLKLDEIKKEKDAKRKKLIKITLPVVTIILLAVIGIYIFTGVFTPKQKYNHALELIEQEKYEESNQILFELGDYENAQELIIENNYQLALVYIEGENYKEAVNLLLNNIDYKEAKSLIINLTPAMFELDKDDESTKECMYITGKEYFAKEKYEEAYTYFEQLQGYKDSNEVMCEVSYVLGQRTYEKGDLSNALQYMNYPYKQNYKDSAVIVSEIKLEYAKEKLAENDGEGAIIFLSHVIEDNVVDLKEAENLLLEAKYLAQIKYVEEDFNTARYADELVLADYKDSRKRFFDYMPPKIQQDLWYLKE